MESADILATRVNPVLSARSGQIGLNLKALHGGTPYIDARLSRFPYEPEASWSGNGQTGAKGRRDRAFLFNYLGRVASKINQYVFDSKPQRKGGDLTWLADVTRTRMTIDALMSEVSAVLTAARWCWIGIDRAGASVDQQTGTVRPRTIAEREQMGDRIFWTLWQPDQVVDWEFDQVGGLLWLITEEVIYRSENPRVAPVHERVRTLWERGGGERMFFDKDGKVARRSAFTLSAPVVPFIPCGSISGAPWWFDDAEMVQASLLNLESANNENLYQLVYPQMVLPLSLQNEGGGGGAGNSTSIDTLTSSGQGGAVKRIGLHYPIFESAEENGTTRYVMPPSDGTKLLPEEISRRKKELFDVVGLALAVPESRQVASAEAKQWDHLDVSAVLAERANLLETIEVKAVAISKQLDSTFKVYEPDYNEAFDLSDLQADFQALLGIANLDLPDGGRREIKYAAVALLHKISPIPDDRRKLIMQEIQDEALDDREPPATEEPPDDPPVDS